ncbi:hypothetical protein J5A99_004206 [Escherichia coli]|jgi:multisubunit Na+/H+ antiporter MnhG subunit|uniref:hypothetical protein n=1 Tax=Enterobacterales TaxID=91347 RepID=UPI000BFFD8C9|nr:hypothetical protein [Serratia sp. BW106]EFC5452063.1 hypothetical protein [Escherichia coli]EHH4435951.1 hypothetical protein [Escherichia coli]EHM0418131.1 hypothetical protein [Escherichia coli]
MQNQELLVEHYHKTYDLTFSVWESRNQSLLILLAVVGFSTLLTFNVSEAQPLLVDIIAKLCGITSDERIKELKNSFPYGVIQSIFIIVVFYLTLNLYHKTCFIRRSYEYLSGLETDIRLALNLPTGSVGFTREGDFYNKNRTFSSFMTGLSYVLILGVLLVSFLGMRLKNDWHAQDYFILIPDACLTLGIMYFFTAYAHTSLKK